MDVNPCLSLVYARCTSPAARGLREKHDSTAVDTLASARPLSSTAPALTAWWKSTRRTSCLPRSPPVCTFSWTDGRTAGYDRIVDLHAIAPEGQAARARSYALWDAELMKPQDDIEGLCTQAIVRNLVAGSAGGMNRRRLLTIAAAF
jgi:hypothetical protein